MEGIFERLRDFRQDVFRNIVSLRETEDLFNDINDGDERNSAVACEAEMEIKADLAPGVICRGFYYSEAIGFPFETQPFMQTRFGDGRFGVWYGSLALETTIHESAYHMMRRVSAIEGVTETVIRERAVYRVFCQALMLDLSEKGADYPQLVDNDYTFTQQIGARVHKEGHPGLLAPSARLRGESNAVVFNPDVLSNARHHCYLTYELNSVAGEMVVSRQEGERLLTLSADRLL
jgi:hypothetical protein